MNIEEAVYKKLLDVHKKHFMYFLQNKTDIYQCVHIKWVPLTLLILKDDLPDEIKVEIEKIVDRPW